MAGKALLGTIPAPRTCSPQELGVPDTQSYGGDDGHDEQDEQHHGQDEEGIPIRAGGEQGSYQCEMVSQPITKQGPKEGLGQVLCAWKEGLVLLQGLQILQGPPSMRMGKSLLIQKGIRGTGDLPWFMVLDFPTWLCLLSFS